MLELSDIKNQLAIYTQGRWPANYLFTEPDRIQKLRALFPEISSNRILTSKELFDLYCIFIEDDADDLSVSYVFIALQHQDGKKVNFLDLLIYLKKLNELTEENFNIAYHSLDLSVWKIERYKNLLQKLPVEFRTITNLLKLLNIPHSNDISSQSNTVEAIIEVWNKRSTDYLNTQEHFDQAIKLYKYHNYAEPPVNYFLEQMVSNLFTDKDYQLGISILSKVAWVKYEILNQFEVCLYLKELGELNQETVSLLSPRFTINKIKQNLSDVKRNKFPEGIGTPITTAIKFCWINAGAINVYNEEFQRLPLGLQTADNFHKILDALIDKRHEQVDIQRLLLVFLTLPENLRRQKNLNQVIQLPDDTTRFEIRDSWRSLPEILRTQEYFDKLTKLYLHPKSNKYYASAAHTIFLILLPFAKGLGFKTKSNIDFLIEHDKVLDTQSASTLQDLMRYCNPEFKNENLLNKIFDELRKKSIEGVFSVVTNYTFLPGRLAQNPQNFEKLEFLFQRSNQNDDLFTDNDAYIVRKMIIKVNQNLVTQANFDSICLCSSIFRRIKLIELLQDFPNHMLTQPVINHLVQECTPIPNMNIEGVKNRVKDFITLTLYAGRPGQNIEPLNNAHRPIITQSTHTKSIHVSVAESATRLMKRYKHLINSPDKLTAIFLQIKAWGEMLAQRKYDDFQENDEKLDAKETIEERQMKIELFDFQKLKAQAAIVSLTHYENMYIDPLSGINTEQALALIWIGINDNSLRIGNLQAAELKMIVSLYDMQRGYNTDDDFVEVDKNAADEIICNSGTFNKIIEIGAGIHPDVVLIFLNKKFATNKLIIVVKEELINHLKEMRTEATTDAKKRNFQKLLDRVRNEGVGSVWNAMKTQVSKRLFDEYGALYGNKINNPEFISFIEGGAYLNLKEYDVRAELNKPEPVSSYSLQSNPTLFQSSAGQGEQKTSDKTKAEDNKPGI